MTRIEKSARLIEAAFDTRFVEGNRLGWVDRTLWTSRHEDKLPPRLVRNSLSDRVDLGPVNFTWRILYLNDQAFVGATSDHIGYGTSKEQRKVGAIRFHNDLVTAPPILVGNPLEDRVRRGLSRGNHTIAARR